MIGLLRIFKYIIKTIMDKSKDTQEDVCKTQGKDVNNDKLTGKTM